MLTARDIRSFVERSKDVLKVSGAQVSPTEIENALLAYPERLIADVTVAGVSGGRTKDEKVPRAWVVLTEEGRKKGERAVVEALHAWVQKNLSKFKWLRGGIEVVDEVRSVLTARSPCALTWYILRFRRTPLGRSCGGFCKTVTNSSFKRSRRCLRLSCKTAFRVSIRTLLSVDDLSVYTICTRSCKYLLVGLPMKRPCMESGPACPGERRAVT